jgi:mannan endo-1,4-beta-mannosidase
MNYLKRFIFLAGLVISIFNQLTAQTFEAENAILVGGAKKVSDINASGGFYVAQEEGHLTWTVNLQEEAFYDIYVHAASPYGGKTNSFSINNAQVDFSFPWILRGNQ